MVVFLLNFIYTLIKAEFPMKFLFKKMWMILCGIDNNLEFSK